MISEHPNLILSIKTGIEDVLILLMEVDQASFLKMAVELQSSEFGNIMHCVADQNMIDFAKERYESIGAKPPEDFPRRLFKTAFQEP